MTGITCGTCPHIDRFRAPVWCEKLDQVTHTYADARFCPYHPDGPLAPKKKKGRAAP